MSEDNSSVAVIYQRPVRWIYAIVGWVASPLDIFAAFLGLLISFALTLTLFSLLMPEINFLLDQLGLEQGGLPRPLLVDLRGLTGHNLMMISISVPSVLIVFLRDQMFTPPKSVAGFAIGVFFAAFGLVSLSFVFLYGPIGLLIPVSYVVDALELSHGGIDYDNMPPSAMGIFMTSVTLFLASFAYLPDALTYLGFRKRIGRLLGSRNLATSIQVAALATVQFIRSLVSGTAFFAGAVVLLSAVAAALTMESLRFAFLLRALFPAVTATVDGVGLLYAVPLFFGGICIVLIRSLMIKRLRNWGTILPLGLLFAGFWVLKSDVLVARAGVDPGVHILIAPLFAAVLVILSPLRFVLSEIRYLLRRAVLVSRKRAVGESGKMLLLRSFALDDVALRRRFRPISLMVPGGTLGSRLEEVVARTCFSLAPLVTVANPAEERPEVGALREYLADDAWQPFVESTIGTADRILFILGTGNFTGWETEKILEAGALHKTLFIVPPDRQPALDYLSGNPNVASALTARHAGFDLLDAVKSRNIKCFWIDRQDLLHLVEGGGQADMDYDLAVWRALTGPMPERASTG